MGTTKAGDLLEYLEGSRPGNKIRELCAKCAMRMILLSDFAGFKTEDLLAPFGWGPEAPIAQ